MRSGSSNVGACERMTMTEKLPPDGLTATQMRNRRRRNLAIGLSVAFLAALFYAITIAKLGPNALQPAP
jgi:hypothetical protein